MTRKILTLIAFLMVTAASYALTNETLRYRVEYKWGLINKTAGTVTIRLNDRTDRYAATLTAQSASWADKFFKVRDTLNCEILKKGFLPIRYEKRAFEGGDYSYETVTYSRNGSSVTGKCTRKKWKDGTLIRDEQKVLNAEGTTIDMLTAFYYMRSLPYQDWQSGHSTKLNIFSGKQKETLTIKYLDKVTVEANKTTYECYHIRFTFTQKGGKKSSDDMDAWISTDPGRIPIKMEGSLPIGKIRCFIAS